MNDLLLSHALLLSLFAETALPDEIQASRSEIVTAAAGLGSKTFEEREAATMLLWRAWPASQSELEKAVKSTDAEVASRAKRVLQRLRYGIYPDTPPEVTGLIFQYRDADTQEKQRLLSQLNEMKQRRVMVTLLRLETDKYTQRHLAKELIAALEKEAFDALVAEKDKVAEELLAWLASLDWGGNAIQNYAAFLLAQNRIAEAIARLRAQALYQYLPNEAKLLAALLYAQGDIGQARSIAELTDDKYFQAALYYELEDWKALARPDFVPGGQGIEVLGFTAAFQRLVGNQTEFDRTAQEISKYASGKPNEVWMCGEALMINGRWHEVRELLSRVRPEATFDLLCGQMKFGEAFQSVGINDPCIEAARWYAKGAVPSINSEAWKQRFLLGIRMASVLNRLGEHEEAARLMESLSTVENEWRIDQFLPLLKMEVTLGRHEQARQHAAKLLRDGASMLTVMHRLYGDQAYTAGEWWNLLRTASTDEQYEVTLSKLDALLRHGKEPLPADLHLVSLAEQAENDSRQLDIGKRLVRLKAIADVCELRGDLELARAYLEKEAALAPEPKESDSQRFKPLRTVRPLLHLGNMWADHERWQDSANAYARAWQLDKRNPEPLYWQGYALLRAGREAEGRRLMDLALILPLGDVTRRCDLAEAMQGRGLSEEAFAQRQLILRIGLNQGWEGNDAWSVRTAAEKIGNELSRRDPLKAASLLQRSLFYLLKTNMAYLDASNYVSTVHRIHKLRALGLLQSGRLEEAIKEIEQAQAATPGDINFIESAFPLLSAAGRGDLAEKLFDEAYKAYETVCRNFPRSALHHNQIAWLAVRCDQRLDSALLHAQEAVRLSADKTGYVDTLAEVYFRRGDRERAVELERQVVEREPRNAHFQEQLRRFLRAQ